MTTAPPWASFFAGYHASLLTGLPLVTDYRDPWTAVQSVNEKLRGRAAARRDIKWQSKFLHHCSLACVITDELGAHYRREFAVEPEKLLVLPIGFDADFAPAPSPGRSSKFSVKYVGSTHMMKLDGFLSALGRLVGRRPELRTSVAIQIIGDGLDSDNLSRLNRSGLADVVAVAGPVSRERAWREMCVADVLLALWLDSKIAYGPGSKVYSYLGSGRPILAALPEGSGARLVRESGQGLVVSPDDITGLEKALEAMFDAWRTGDLAKRFPSNPSYVEQFGQGAMMLRLDTALRRILEE